MADAPLNERIDTESYLRSHKPVRSPFGFFAALVTTIKMRGFFMGFEDSLERSVISESSKARMIGHKGRTQ
jgi:hypothetical protein